MKGLIAMIKMNVKKLDERAQLPVYKTADSAGYDIYALERTSLIKGGSPKMIRTGIAIDVECADDIVIILAVRSSIGKRGINLANGIGVIDKDYRGEICVLLQNTGGHDIEIINEGDRIAQLIIMPIAKPIVTEVNELSDTERGVGGFGSTGK